MDIENVLSSTKAVPINIRNIFYIIYYIVYYVVYYVVQSICIMYNIKDVPDFYQFYVENIYKIRLTCVHPKHVLSSICYCMCLNKTIKVQIKNVCLKFKNFSRAYYVNTNK